MPEINMPQELMDKAIEAMMEKLIEDGLNYSLREAVEAKLKARLEESGIVDDLADAILTKVIADQDAIVAKAGDAIIMGIGQSLAKAYKAAAEKIVERAKGKFY